MRNNHSANFIPVPTRPAKSTPRPSSMRPPVYRKSSSCQTDRLILLKEENLQLNPYPKQNDGGMRRDYMKAVNYINSCHKFINGIIEKNADGPKGFLLPTIPNFAPLFNYLTQQSQPSYAHMEERKNARKRDESPSPSTLPFNYVPRVNSRNAKCKSASPGRVENVMSDERKKKSQFGMKKSSCDKADNVPVGDCTPSSAKTPSTKSRLPSPLPEKRATDDKIGEQVADILKGQVNTFLSSLQVDIHKATQQIISDASTTEEKCRNLEVISQRLEDLSSICHQKKPITTTATTTVVGNKKLPSPRNRVEDIFIMAETLDDNDDKEEVKVLAYASVSTLDSESSSIRSDTDVEK